MALPNHKTAPEANNVLFKAFFNSLKQLGLDNNHAAKILGVDRTTITRIKNKGIIKAKSKSGEIALLAIRVYRSLYAMVGGDCEMMHHWMHTNNKHLNGIPAELICTIPGLVHVTEYLDAMRGKV
ncbi:MAG: DUF2384 domain-containing protein [Gammaproteobacteria bacterium]|nr:MAG: DUF2384 domain-containing protein [Gammaproteobacteria bacterium]